MDGSGSAGLLTSVTAHRAATKSNTLSAKNIVADRVERPCLFHLTPNVLQPLLRPFRQTCQVGFHVGVFDCDPFALGDLIES